MCWVCDNYSKSSVMYRLGPDFDALRGEFDTFGGQPYTYFKADPTAFYDTVTGDRSSLLAPYDTVLALPILVADTEADNINTSATITVDGAHIVSTINTIGDQDFFKVELEAGKTYEIGQYAAVAGPSGVPLSDAFIELYDSTGKLISFTDGGGRTPGGEAYGLDALFTFTPTVSGTYYINARAFEGSTTDGSDKGDSIGDYELFVDSVAPDTYRPYYSPDSPLHSIDWGTQVDGTSRNPDGQEGPRVTGNAFTGHAYNEFGIVGKNVITYYFAKQGDIFIDEDPTTIGLTTTMVAQGMEQWEKDAFYVGFAEFEKVADLVYVEVQDRAAADFIIITYEGTPGRGTPSVLGRMSPPDTDNEGQTEFNSGDERWTEAQVQQGGFYFGTIVHELGHGHGMAHAHDTGGRSSVMRGVTQQPVADTPVGPIDDPTNVWPDYTIGDYDLNQGVYTMMAYQDGWYNSPYGQPTSQTPYGWLGSLMAMDIAVIQDKYGVNEEWATGDDVYVIKDENAPGTYYSSIWDAGGTDIITYSGARDANIDLRPATLKYEYGGGGWISYAWGIHGGFTIANGVTIENAKSGAGNDKLIGNDAANMLDAGAGDDNLDGGAGNDRLIGGAGKDSLTGGSGNDTFVFASGDSAVGLGRDVVTDFASGDRIDLTGAGAKSFIGNNAFTGSAGQVRSVNISGQTIIELDSDGNGLADLQLELAGDNVLSISDFVGLVAVATNGNDNLTGTSGADTIRGLGGNDVLRGLAGDDTLDGGFGDDVLIGGLGRDLLTGGAGADRFRLENAAESSIGGRDRILDFQQGLDKIDLSSVFEGELAYIGKKSFSGAAGQLRYVRVDGVTLLEGDLNGDRVADFQIELAGRYEPVVTDFVL
jgi:serralysin